jgi:hypothetical protein
VKQWQKFSLIFIASGIIVVIAISIIIQQNFVVTPSHTSEPNKLSSIISMNNSTATVVSSGRVNSTSNPTGITYTTKFECGSIFAGEGPLRPGHYDTDLSIFNKQRFQTAILWNVVVNNGPTSNAILLSQNAETSTGVTCEDIRRVLGNSNENFLEGFIIINVPLDSTIQPSKGSVIQSLSGNDINVLDVQVFYTANALDTLPHEVIIDKISFDIIQDQSGKIPVNMMQKTLDISIPSGLNEISDTEKKVKNALAKQYTLSDDDLGKITIRIDSVSVGVGVLIDDHAISLSTVKPELDS